MPKNRDEYPTSQERVARVNDLLTLPAMPLGDVALLLDIPLSTVDKLRAQGRGPQCFLIGRRLYVRQVDLRTWLDCMAESAVA